MPRVIYDIPENAKEEVSKLMRIEKNAVVKERLWAVSMFLDGVPKGEIKKLMHRGANFVGTWISAYFKGGIEALADNRGGDRKSKLTPQQMQELKRIITTSYPVYAKGWSGHSIADLIEHYFHVTYTRDSVYPILKKLNLTHKIATKVDPKKSELTIAAWKEDIKKSS